MAEGELRGLNAPLGKTVTLRTMQFWKPSLERVRFRCTRKSAGGGGGGRATTLKIEALACGVKGYRPRRGTQCSVDVRQVSSNCLPGAQKGMLRTWKPARDCSTGRLEGHSPSEGLSHKLITESFFLVTRFQLTNKYAKQHK